MTVQWLAPTATEDVPPMTAGRFGPFGAVPVRRTGESLVTGRPDEGGQEVFE
jgi:hypothetical protein